MEYRDFSTITDDEIKFIINDLFDPIRIGNIDRTGINDNIIVDIFTMPNYPNIKDTITINSGDIFSKDFGGLKAERKLYRQYLFSLGMNEMFKDNPYMDKNIERDKEQDEEYTR